MSRSIGFRGWFYFRQGWSVYFAFIFAAVNTLTVTYFLAIENYPILKEVFPSFSHYIEIVVAIGGSPGGRAHARTGDRYQDMKEMGIKNPK